MNFYLNTLERFGVISVFKSFQFTVTVRAELRGLVFPN